MKPAPPVTTARTGSYPTVPHVRDLRGARRLRARRRRPRSSPTTSSADGREVVATREPGGTPLGERVRELLLDGPRDVPVGRGRALHRRAGGARRAGDPAGARRAAPTSSATATSTPRSPTRGSRAGSGSRRCSSSTCDAIARRSCPTVTFLLLVDPRRRSTARARRRDRIEREGDAFLRRVDGGYRELAAALPASASSCSTATGRRTRSPSEVLERGSRPSLSRPRRSALLAGGARRGAGARVPLPRPAGRREARAALAFAAALLGEHGRVERAVASRPLRARAARRPDPDRRDPRAAARPAHAPVRGRPARLPDLRRALDERGRGRRAAQGSRGAAAVRGDRARRRRRSARCRRRSARAASSVPFRRLSERAVRAAVAERAPGLSDERGGGARARRGRAARPGRAAARSRGGRAARRRCSSSRGPSTATPSFDAGRCGGARCIEAAAERAREARAKARGGARGAGADRPRGRAARAAGQRGAEREELLLALEELAAWYRDLVASRVGAERAAIHVDQLDELREDASAERTPAPRRAAEPVREHVARCSRSPTLRPPLALEALFVQLRRALT